MPARAHGERLDRLEKVVQVIAEDQLSLQKLIAQLATETRRGFDRVAKQFAETEKQMREVDRRSEERDRKLEERDRKLDERVDKLVLAMGEFIRRQDSPRK